MKKVLLGAVLLLLALSKAAIATSQDISSTTACKEGKPECVDLVIQEMQRRYQLLEQEGSHDDVFALQYLRTTEVFRQTLDEIGYNNPTSVIREDALFADYYFRAYDNYYSGADIVPPVWKVAFDGSSNRTVAGSGNLTLGIAAHILRDLPFVLYELDLQGHPVSYEDHTAVNQFLVKVDTLDELATKFDPTIDDADVPGTEDDQERFQLIVQWRELSYRNYERLRDAPTVASRAQVAAEIEGLGLFAAQNIFDTYKYPSGTDSSARDAYAQQYRKSVPEPSATYALLGLSCAGVFINHRKLKTIKNRTFRFNTRD